MEELAAALGVQCERDAENTGLPAGEVFVDGGLVVATMPCFVAVVDGKRFRDPTSALLYVRVLGEREDA